MTSPSPIAADTSRPPATAACSPPRVRTAPGLRVRAAVAAWTLLGLMAGPAALWAQPAATGEPPVITADDPSIGDAVMDGPSEPAAGRTGAAATPGPVEPGAADVTGPPAGMAFAPLGPDAAAASPRASASPVVVELFTAQGCSSCPPADALLGELAGRTDVLPLAFHVDYWDYLGWADKFARPQFTARQQAYGRRTGERAIYTPQMVIGGEDTLIDLGPATLEALIDAHQAEGSPVSLAVNQTGGRIVVDLSAGPVPLGPSSIDLVRFLPERATHIAAGENRGRSIVYRNVVVSIERLAVWDGSAPLRLTVTLGEGAAQQLPIDTRHALLVQQMAPRRSLGDIVAAVPLD